MALATGNPDRVWVGAAAPEGLGEEGLGLGACFAYLYSPLVFPSIPLRRSVEDIWQNDKVDGDRLEPEADSNQPIS